MKRFLVLKVLTKRKIGLLNYGGYELIDDSHIESIDKIDLVNNKLKSIFRSEAFIIKNEKIKNKKVKIDIAK
jgi:hypothetical protein